MPPVAPAPVALRNRGLEPPIGLVAWWLVVLSSHPCRQTTKQLHKIDLLVVVFAVSDCGPELFKSVVRQSVVRAVVQIVT